MPAQDAHKQVDQPPGAPMVFLVGPPGSGKSALGRRVYLDIIDLLTAETFSLHERNVG